MNDVSMRRRPITSATDAPALIDHAIRTALREKKPAYIEIACNISAAPCAAPGPVSSVVAEEPSVAPVFVFRMRFSPRIWFQHVSDDDSITGGSGGVAWIALRLSNAELPGQYLRLAVTE